MSVVLNVSEICGDKIVTRDHGSSVNDRLREVWSVHDTIVVDFDNLTIASVSFLDQAIGVLALEYEVSKINEKLSFTNMNEFDRKLLDDILVSRERQRKSNGRKTSRRRAAR